MILAKEQHLLGACNQRNYPELHPHCHLLDQQSPKSCHHLPQSLIGSRTRLSRQGFWPVHSSDREQRSSFGNALQECFASATIIMHGSGAIQLPCMPIPCILCTGMQGPAVYVQMTLLHLASPPPWQPSSPAICFRSSLQPVPLQSQHPVSSSMMAASVMCLYLQQCTFKLNYHSRLIMHPWTLTLGSLLCCLASTSTFDASCMLLFQEPPVWVSGFL